MISELLGEIYWMVAKPAFIVLGVVCVALLVSYIVRQAIKFVNDEEYEVYYFFTDDNEGLINKLTCGLGKYTYAVVDALWLGAFVVPAIYVICIFLWPATTTVLCIYGLLMGIRGFTRLKKKVEKHIRTQEEE
jgi:hypothetical protein